MNWFDEQIKLRKINDEDSLDYVFRDIADAVLGYKNIDAIGKENKNASSAIDRLMDYYHLKYKETDSENRDFNEELEYRLRPHGIMSRNVILEKNWHNDAVCPMIGVVKETGDAVAMLPGKFGGFYYHDPATGKKIAINKQREQLFEKDAIAFYLPFPTKKLSIKDLLMFIFKRFTLSDGLYVVGIMLIATLVGMLIPKINYVLFGEVIENGLSPLYIGAIVFLLSVNLSSMLLNTFQSAVNSRISTKLNTTVEAATMMRILSLPAGFFNNYSAGELQEYQGYLNSLCSILFETLFTTSLSSLFSLAYVTQIFVYAPSLVVPSLLITLASTVFSLISTFAQIKISERKMQLSAKESGLGYALISGIQKIKLSGAEKRAFAKWGEIFAKQSALEYNPPMFLKINSVIASAITLVGTLVMYGMAISSGVSRAEYIAFESASGMVSGAFTSLAGIALTVANIKPILKMAKPLLDAEPEVSEGKTVIDSLSGNIEMNNIYFRYNEDMPYIFENFSLKIKKGQYLAIVGKTGCGKSTLVRLLLGFEKASRGAIYYDGKDINSIDPKSLRKNIGTVTQNGKLLQGDIFSNITISAPYLTLDDAWEAAELANIADDIREMPMGMHTVISEGQGGFSGGQKQRLMIARAVAHKPKVLIFDEATSALDNITQKNISKSLDELKCTRIVIAHRLSTIKNCDRIVVIDGGKIIEDGTYDELIAKKGYFAELVERQRLDN